MFKRLYQLNGLRWIVLCLIFNFYTGSISPEKAIPPLTDPIVDTVALLSADQASQLRSISNELERQKGAQLVLVIIDSLEEETIEQFSMRASEKWKIGRKNIDDGVLLIIAMRERTIRIEVGYGLEGAIPDVTAKRIISERITPQFKNENYFEGILAGFDALQKLILNEELPEITEDKTDTYLVIWLIVFLIIRFIVNLFMNELILFFTGPMAFYIVAFLLITNDQGQLLTFTILAAILPYASHFSGSARGGKGTGGFSGGGGIFGGGGASGRW